MTERRDASLGMNRSITRRDFLYGIPAAVGLMAACGRQPGGAIQPSSAVDGEALRREINVGDDWYGPGGIGDYSSSHGNTPDVLKVAHQVRDRRFDDIAGQGIDTGEEYDLVIVGGGFSGLAAAHHFRRLNGAAAPHRAAIESQNTINSCVSRKNLVLKPYFQVKRLS